MEMDAENFETLARDIRDCRLCSGRFRATATGHEPRPVFWVEPGARILISGQAPGARVHAAGQPFTDRSGDRLRDWLGLDEGTFYDRSRVAILPMGLCFPGYDNRGSDLPPPKICAQTWRNRVLRHVPDLKMTLLIGAHAMDWHLGRGTSVRERVANWRALWPGVVPLPHPSWRNTAWLKRNPWFEAEVVPALRARVQEILK